MPSIIVLRDVPIQYHVRDEEVGLEDLGGEWVSLILMEGGGLLLRTSSIASIRQVTMDQYNDMLAKKKAAEEKMKFQTR